MRALVLRDFGTLSIEDRPAGRPGPGEVQLRVAATGICGSDLHGFTGQNGRRHPGQVMGHETVGRIAAVGPDVPDPPPVGQLVTVNPVIYCGQCERCRSGREQSCPHRRVIGVDPAISSAFADYLTVPARNAVPLPETLPVGYGALVEPLAVAYHAARRGGCGPADTVLVLGGGPIGQSAVLACRRLGARRVVVSEPDRRRRDLCARLGADTLDPTTGDLPARVAALLAGLVTLALDAAGSSETLADALSCTALGANVVLVGMNSPRIELPAFAISTGERTLIGSFCYSADDFRRTAEWVGTGPAELAELIDRQVPPVAAPGAFASLAADPVPGKVLVRFDDQPGDAR